SAPCLGRALQRIGAPLRRRPSRQPSRTAVVSWSWSLPPVSHRPPNPEERPELPGPSPSRDGGLGGAFEAPHVVVRRLTSRKSTANTVTAPSETIVVIVPIA